MPCHLHLHEGLHGKPQLHRIKPRGVACDQPFGFQTLPAPSGLAGRKVQRLAKFLRSQVGIALQGGQKARISFIQNDA